MKHSKKRGYFPFVQWKMLKEIAYLERKNKQSIERLQLRYDNLSSLCRYIKQAIGDMDSDLQFKVDYMVKLLEKKYRMIYINEITGEPYLEIDEREPTEEEWDRFLEKKGMKRRDKSRFTKTDVKSICELSNELIRYRQGYAFMANMIVNISAGKEGPPILLDFLPDDEHARFLHRTIREWGEKIYKDKA